MLKIPNRFEGIRKFETAGQITSWLRPLARNKITCGKILSNHTPKGSSRLKIAFRIVVNLIGKMGGWQIFSEEILLRWEEPQS